MSIFEMVHFVFIALRIKKTHIIGLFNYRYLFPYILHIYKIKYLHTG